MAVTPSSDPPAPANPVAHPVTRKPVPCPHPENRRLIVVMKGYPRLSETFIAQELLALQERGFRFDIWSLREPYDDQVHAINKRITASSAYLPEYLHEAPGRVLIGVLRAMMRAGFWGTLGTWLRDLARDVSRNRVRRFGQACVLAAEMPRDADFLYAHFLHTPSSVARYAAGIRGLGWGFSAHAKDIWTTPDWEKREKIEDATFGVTCTSSGATHLRNLRPGKVSLVYHGLDLSRFPEPPERKPHDEPFRILSVGRLVEKKGYDDLLEALALLPADLEWRFVHIGGGKLDKKLRAQAKRLGLTDRILWLSKRDQSEVVREMREADLFVLPSKVASDGDRDGLPNVLMEAASQLLPILSTDTAAIPEFITDAVHGRLVPAEAPTHLAEAILTLSGAPETRARLAAAAFKRLKADFGMDAGIELLAERLTRALNHS